MTGELFSKALEYLRRSTANPEANFREGQWEAIERLVVERSRVLVVQRTGWGKSLVYFIATRLLRDSGKGPTLLVSPLLSLMRDQEIAASRVGLRVARIDSTNRDGWDRLESDIRGDRVDIILISPERLANAKFVDNVISVVAPRLALLVIDEAHCISDWGHDFRPDYRRIGRIVRGLPEGFPVLATTATANVRVVEDVRSQLGDEVLVQRGELTRTSLRLRNFSIGDLGERLAWLVRTLPSLPGSGIVYVLTVRDALSVAEWLNESEIQAEPYFGGLNSDRRVAIEEGLRENRIKVVVATSALGMGFDKPDLGFVIHFQTPQSIIHYYQQVGRAGRAMPKAYGILLNGLEDRDIVSHFIENAFPNEQLIEQILGSLEQTDLSVNELESRLNVGRSALSQALKTLETEEPTPIVKVGSRYRRTPVVYAHQTERVDAITALRWREWEEMEHYLESEYCLMQRLAIALGDEKADECGQCSVCSTVEPFLSEPIVADELLRRAQHFLRRLELAIQPRRRWPKGAMTFFGFTGNITKPNEEGRALARLGDPGWGRLVASGQSDGAFSTELLEAVKELLERWDPQPAPVWITAIPSLNKPDAVSEFAKALAEEIGLPFRPALRRVKKIRPPDEMANSFYQAKNLDGSMKVNERERRSGPVLLITDVVDSRWTLTVAGALLRQAGVDAVLPVALADASVV